MTVLSPHLSLRSAAVRQSGAGVGTDTKEQEVTFFCPISQVTLNNVEICSENISTLKKTLEVQRKLPTALSHCSLPGREPWALLLVGLWQSALSQSLLQSTGGVH